MSMGSDPPLSTLFSPDAIALVGASADPDKLSGRPHRFLEVHGYDGRVFLVNPNRDAIDGQRCFDSVLDLPVAPDVALVLVPADLAAPVVRECGERGVPFAVVIASEFAETGEAGERRESALVAAAEESGVRLLGPNSEGFLNLRASVAASFSSICTRESLLAGNVGFVTQSGGFGGALFQLTQDRGVGATTWVSTGNEADLDTLDVLDHFVEDPATAVVAAFIESLSDGRRLLRLGRRAAETGTAIVAMRVGASARGEQAARSHTGSIASDDAVYDAAFRQSGVVRVRDTDAFVDAVVAFARTPPTAFPEPDRGLGVVSISGGAAVLIADACDRLGVPMGDFGERTTAVVDDIIPSYGSTANPMDVTAAAISDPAVFDRCIRAVAEDEAVGSLLIQFGNSGREMVETFRENLLALRQDVDFPVVTVFTGSTPRAGTVAALREAGILVFEDPVRAVATVGRLFDRARFLAASVDTAPASDPVGANRHPLPTDGWPALRRALADHGVTVAMTQRVPNADEAVDAADDLGYPVVLKYDPLEVAHKVDRDGVRTGVGRGQVREAFDSLAGGDGHEGPPVVVQESVDGIEVIAGVVDDPDFGPVMLVGPGGVFVELFGDDAFAYRCLPITEPAARRMVAETPVDRLLDGFRGLDADRDALVSLLVGLGTVYETYDLRELECNPVIVRDDGAVAVDLLVRSGREAGDEGRRTESAG